MQSPANVPHQFKSLGLLAILKLQFPYDNRNSGLQSAAQKEGVGHGVWCHESWTERQREKPDPNWRATGKLGVKTRGWGFGLGLCLSLTHSERQEMRNERGAVELPTLSQACKGGGATRRASKSRRAGRERHNWAAVPASASRQPRCIRLGVGLYCSVQDAI